MPFEVVHGDITKIQCDAVVNAANSGLKAGGGVCGAIFTAAGKKKLQEECDKIGSCNTGRAVITGGYDLPAQYIIHTVGPVWNGGGHGEEELLRSCYLSSLELAKEHGLKSITFPLISSGIFGYPKEQAKKVAETAIKDFLRNNDMDVKLILFNK